MNKNSTTISDVIQLLEREIEYGNQHDRYLEIDDIEIELLAKISSDSSGRGRSFIEIVNHDEKDQKKSGEFHRIRLKLKPRSKSINVSVSDIADKWVKLSD